MSDSEMRNFLQDQGFWEPADNQGDCITAKGCEEIKGLRGDVLWYVAQGFPQIDPRRIDAEIVKLGTRAEGVGSPREAFGQKGPFLDGH
ncbi:MAG: hypothetical protein JSV50_14505 [Desulfobacteraceae bacterium]|nr:MAG: hypothetical protein JSV50_14505 [Desulfobacteraceae bacterium]